MTLPEVVHFHLPGIDSRWVRKNMSPGYVCSQCQTELPVNGEWVEGEHFFCNSNCHSAYREKYDKIIGQREV